MKRVDVPFGIVVVGVVLVIGSRLITWWPGVIMGTALILGGLAAEWGGRRRQGSDT